tara:strand:+ start:89 stop:247 length:159 start_codon:yes stop_codon:yes gene_type:complete
MIDENKWLIFTDSIDLIIICHRNARIITAIINKIEPKNNQIILAEDRFTQSS